MPNTKTKSPTDSQTPSKDAIDSWFHEFISHIQADHFMISQGAATEDTKNFYNKVITGDGISLATQARNMSSMMFIQYIITDYLTELNKQERKPLSLALGLSDSKILVWAVVEDDDEATEDALLLAEARVNGKYYQHGFYLNSTIVEKSDKIPTPPHYSPIIQ